MLELKSESGLKLFKFNNLDKYKEISHFVSGREGGVSQGETGSLNLSFTVPDKPENVMENRRRIADSFSISPEKLVFPQQTHTNNVGIVTKENYLNQLADTDAVITNETGICIAVMSADCVPILLFDPVKKVVAAVHAGWRGTVARIVSRAVVVMKNHYGSNPADLIAGIGPSICSEVYEVGEEVVNAVENTFTDTEKILNPGKPGKAFLNLWEANKADLLSTGIKAENIEIAGKCTFLNSDLFFSARKSKESGRFGAGIMLN